MLDGILGRGFSVKCKSLIKTTRARIEVVRRRAEAKQRFLNEDLAKLLSNGLDINAYGRTEEFLAGMNLLSCYDFVEQSCEYIVKQLPRMQKQGECPEECREAVGSLMYAAARFSDLPELRDLRDIFQQRYGNCLEAFVNQKFVEKLSSRPPPKEKRLQVLQDIASEFSIKWDSRGFERRMATPSVVAQVDEKKVDTVKQRPGLLDEKSRMHSCGEGNIWRRDEGDHHISGRKETIECREKSFLKSGGSSSQGDDDILFCRRHGLIENKRSYPIEKGGAELNVERSNISSHGKILDNNVHTGYERRSNGICSPRKRESTEALFHEKADFAISCVENLGKTGNAISYNYSNQDNTLNSIRKGLDEGSDRLKSCSSFALPPPYIKSNNNISRPPCVKPKEDKHNIKLKSCSSFALPPPYIKSNNNISRPPCVKPKEDKHKLSRGSKHAASDLDEHFIDPGSCNRSNVVNSSGRSHNEPDHHDCEEQFVAPAKVKSFGHERELAYQDEKIPLPKPRSIRRKHHKSSSSYNVVDTLEDDGAVNRSSSSRRKDRSRKGLQILFDEEHHRKDDEERMIDKLLIHYSKKPSSYDPGKLRKKLPGQPSHQIITDGEPSLDQSRNVHDGKCEMFPPPTRSVSLPHEQAASPELKKVFARSNTFQPDNQASHVHPKLPDYDDLAARFAALKGR